MLPLTPSEMFRKFQHVSVVVVTKIVRSGTLTYDSRRVANTGHHKHAAQLAHQISAHVCVCMYENEV